MPAGRASRPGATDARAAGPARAPGVPRGARPALTTRGQSFVASGGMLLACGLVLGLGDLVRLGLLLVGLVGVAVLAARRSPASLATGRALSPSALTVGEPAQVLLTVRNDGSRRTPVLAAVEQVPRSLGDRPRVVLPPLAPGEQRHLRYAVTPHARGELALGPLAVDVRDPFGLATRAIASGRSHVVLVRPRLVPLGGRAAAGAAADGSGGSVAGGDLGSPDDLLVRPYRDGDEQRRIHWKASAHAGELMVRQDERPVRRRAVVLLDSRRGAHTDDGAGSTFEWAVTAAASVAEHLVGAGFEVSLVADGTVGEVDLRTAAGSGRRAVVGSSCGPAAQDALARATLGGDDAFTRCVHVAGDLMTTGGLLVAVVGAPASADAEDGLGATRHPGTRAVGIVVHGPSREEPAARVVAGLARRGWRVAPAGPGDDVAAVWDDATARGTVHR